jgi:hypothetical protein
VPERVISLNQSLSLNFGIGGQQGSCAFYQPQGRLLALAKNAGGGSLAHEWFHAFDHYICSKLFTDELPTTAFASSSWLNNATVSPHPLNTYLDQSFATLFLSATGTEPNSYVKTSAAFDQSHGIYYYAKPEELAARAFEHMLQQQRLKNSFLVSGTLKSKAAKAGLYPDPALSAVLAQHWLGYFSLLGRALS